MQLNKNAETHYSYMITFFFNFQTLNFFGQKYGSSIKLLKKKKKKNLSITSSDQVSQEGVQAISACADFS